MECTVKDVEAFLAEAIVMKDCHHDNVLSLLGVVIAGHRPFAVLPYMEHGDLRSYIAEPDRVRRNTIGVILYRLTFLTLHFQHYRS